MLASHSQLAFPPETSFIRRYVLTQKLKRSYEKGGLEAVASVVASDSRIARLGVDLDELLSPFSSNAVQFGDALFYSELLRKYAASKQKNRIGDKDPRGTEYLPVIYHYWPDSFVIHLIRDPRDVLASKKKAAWSKKRSAFLHIFANRVQCRMAREMGSKLFGERYQEIFYEELISNTEYVLRHVCRNLGLRFEQRMLDFSAAAKDLVSDSEISWKKETLGPLLMENKGKWKTSLNDLEIALTEAVCTDAFDSGLYERINIVDKFRVHKQAYVWIGRRLIEIMDYLYTKYHKFNRFITQYV
jgi:hypothetical protein